MKMGMTRLVFTTFLVALLHHAAATDANHYAREVLKNAMLKYQKLKDSDATITVQAAIYLASQDNLSLVRHLVLQSIPFDLDQTLWNMYTPMAPSSYRDLVTIYHAIAVEEFKIIGLHVLKVLRHKRHIMPIQDMKELLDGLQRVIVMMDHDLHWVLVYMTKTQIPKNMQNARTLISSMNMAHTQSTGRVQDLDNLKANLAHHLAYYNQRGGVTFHQHAATATQPLNTAEVVSPLGQHSTILGITRGDVECGPSGTADFT
ncbi:hypothetical protein SeMB42_g05352, partial [Synchytrium endobioticum]